MKDNKKYDNFGLIEMLGSVVLLLIDPDRFNNKKYLNKEHYKANRITGIIIISILILLLLYFLFF